MRIVNLTQHAATPDQVQAGVYDLTGSALEELKILLTFDHFPVESEMRERAKLIQQLAMGADAAMIGGALYFMPVLAERLKSVGIQPLYSFTLRESVETVQPDGSVTKTAVFRHKGFVKG